ncbi:hypothetical protein AAMO2058_001477200 [Amorphochlora amoebiformis]
MHTNINPYDNQFQIQHPPPKSSPHLRPLPALPPPQKHPKNSRAHPHPPPLLAQVFGSKPYQTRRKPKVFSWRRRWKYRDLWVWVGGGDSAVGVLLRWD